MNRFTDCLLSNRKQCIMLDIISSFIHKTYFEFYANIIFSVWPNQNFKKPREAIDFIGKG